jgi:uncharacterized protein YgiM (DUF1202 family)
VEASLEYGDGVTFLADQSGWYQIELSDGQIGWIFSDAVDENRTADIVLQGERQERRTVTSREIALAGRGFSENLEQELSEDQKVDFSAVDELERRSIGSDQLIAFLTEAELRLDALEAAE